MRLVPLQDRDARCEFSLSSCVAIRRVQACKTLCVVYALRPQDPHREPAFTEINQDDDAAEEIVGSPRRGLGSQVGYRSQFIPHVSEP